MERQTNLEDVLKLLEGKGSGGIYIALLGPGTLIYPVEERIVDSVFGEVSHRNVEISDCEGLNAQAILNRLKSQSLIGGPRIVVLRNFSKSSLDGLSRLADWFKKNKEKKSAPLVIIEDEVLPQDRQLKGIFNEFTLVIDLSFHALSKKDRVERARTLIDSWLKEAGKTITNDARELFLNSIDLKDPAYIKTELEKVISGVGNRTRITVQDVAKLTVETKQEEIYEFTHALGKKDRTKAYMVLANLLNHGVHPLAILQLLSTWLARVLVLKTIFRDSLGDPDRVSYNIFQAKILPKIKDELGEPLPWPLAKMKPYALFNLWKASMLQNERVLIMAIKDLPRLDIALKSGSGLERIHIERFMERFLDS